MLDFNFWSALFVLCWWVAAFVMLGFRFKQTGNVAMIGLLLSVLPMIISYAIFTVNAYYVLPNAEYRYLLRFATGSMGLSIFIFTRSNYIDDNDRERTRKKPKGE